MTFTNLTENSLETIIIRWLTQHNNYEQGSNNDYCPEFTLDTTRLLRFLHSTQPTILSQSGVLSSENRKREFFALISSEISQRGIVDVLRNGVDFYSSSFILFYLTPSDKNIKAQYLYSQNIFSVTPQLRYSKRNRRLALDLCIFINGIPVITIELKNSLTGSNTDYAVSQYMRTRDPREPLFSFKRCIVHFAADDLSVEFCTRLDGKNSRFLPFNKGCDDGAGNPPNPEGLMTDYLWKDILTKEKLTLIVESFACLVDDEQIFPRYHQLDAVTKIIADVLKNGVGQRYLIQHSAGSGKSNSIAWLAHQLAGLEQNGHTVFDSVFVVTDRKILDRQIRSTVENFTQVSSTVIHADHSRDLKEAIRNGKRIIITTIEKFPYISEEIGNAHKGRRFAVIIDEAHSSQNGKYSAEMTRTLSAADDEDAINILMESRKLLTNASYFAFTATPKSKTLEVFGTPYYEDGEIMHKPFHVYTMKQAIQEGFILDVLQNYTPVKSYYRLVKTVEDDPEFERKRAMKELKRLVQEDSRTIAGKAAMMVQHFHEQVYTRGKIGGQARAMIVTASIHSCIEYYRAVNECLAGKPYKALIAFSGTNNDFGGELTSAGLNGFSDSQIPQKFRERDYRLLIVADMFQTGFDEPLLHTMYIDKEINGIKAVQTLSRLNRTCPGKHETFILDFANNAEEIVKAFSGYYTTVLLSGETDTARLRELEAAVMGFGVFTRAEAENLVKLYTDGAGREKIDPVLDMHASICRELDAEVQTKFKRTARAFVRAYNFLGAVLPCCNAGWERLCIFLTLLLPKLTFVRGDDFPSGLADRVDLESYRVEAERTMSLALEDTDAVISPAQVPTTAKNPEPEKDLLSLIVSEFNRRFRDSECRNAESVCRKIYYLAEKFSSESKFRNALNNSDEQGLQFEIAEALQQELASIAAISSELYGLFHGNEDFRKWLILLIVKVVCNGRVNLTPSTLFTH